MSAALPHMFCPVAWRKSVVKGWIDTILSFLKHFLAPILAYLKGRGDANNDNLKKKNAELRKQNKALLGDVGASDNVLAFKLRERANKKRK